MRTCSPHSIWRKYAARGVCVDVLGDLADPGQRVHDDHAAWGLAVAQRRRRDDEGVLQALVFAGRGEALLLHARDVAGGGGGGRRG